MFFLKDLPTREMLNAYGDVYPDMKPDAVEKALILLRHASLLMRDLEKYFAKHSLSQTRFIILILLDRQPDQDGLTAIDLVSKMDISKTVISKTVHSLEKEGLIKISEHKHDARSKWLRLTVSGKKVLSDVLPGYYKIINDFMENNDTQAP
ncbi:MAG: MarR family winged helix-turn-helix transcriptional regulator [Methyloligellaceae bacterium]